MNRLIDIKSRIFRLNIIVLIEMTVLCFGLTEAIWGTLQLFDFIPSGHFRYPVTGSFYNPGPYGCFIGSILPIAISIYIRHNNPWYRIPSMCYILLVALLLPGGMSRTGCMAAILGSGIVIIGHYRHYVIRFKRHRILLVAIITLFCMGVVGAYYLKPDSADGRILIWKIAAKAAANAPLYGVGWDNVAGAYGDAQEAYFAAGLGTEKEEMLAGTPSYVFNEYLQIAIAYGIPASLSFIALIITSFTLYWRKLYFGLASTIVALSVSCIASYPLQFWEFKILIGLVVVGAFLVPNSKLVGILATSIYIGLWGYFCIESLPVNVSTEFNRAQRATRIGRYDASNKILMDILPKTSDAMPLNIMGKNYQSMGLRDSAEYYFFRASVRVPNRIYPHYLLMKLYAETPSDSIKMKRQAEIVLTKQPKKHSTAIEEMGQEARIIINNP